MPDPSLEKKKLNIKEVGVRGAIVHFWTYYKWWVIIPVIVIICIFSLVNSYLKATRKTYLNVVMVNARYDGGPLVFAEYEQSIGQEITVDSTYHAPTNDQSIDVSTDLVNSQQKLISLLTSGVVDIVVTNARSIKELGQNGVRDLHTVLTDEQIAELEQRDMIYYMDFESEQHVPVAINVTGLESFEPAYSGSDEKHYMFFSPFSDKTKEEKLLAEYFFFQKH